MTSLRLTGDARLKEIESQKIVIRSRPSIDPFFTQAADFTRRIPPTSPGACVILSLHKFVRLYGLAT